MASSLAGLSASVTRILSLSGFSKELKTKDIQAAFANYDSVNGGFKIKWKDDTSLFIVFQDPSVAKRAYLITLAFPPPVLSSPTGASATIRPYDGPDAQAVIQSVNSRGHHSNPSRTHNSRASSSSISTFPSSRSFSGSSLPSNSNLASHRSNPGLPLTIPEHQPVPGGREPSPTLPSLPSQPTLNYLINSSLSEVVTGPNLATGLQQTTDMNCVAGPRIGDPGKRMLGAALGVRHPGLVGSRVAESASAAGSGHIGGSRSPSQGGTSSLDQTMKDVQNAFGGIVVAE